MLFVKAYAQVTVVRDGLTPATAFTDPTQWASTADGTYWFDICGTGTPFQTELLNQQVLALEAVAAGTGTSRVVLTTSADYTIDWGDGSTSNQDNYANHVWAAVGPYTIKVYSSDPSKLSQWNSQQSGLNSFTPTGALCNLVRLNVRTNNFTEIPAEIRYLTRLQIFTIWGNDIVVIPPEIQYLTELIDINFGINDIVAIPPEIQYLTNLEIFSIGRNKITAIPPEIQFLSSLNDFDIGQNQLTSVPAEIQALTTLSILRLDNNNLTSLPPEIQGLTDLRTLAINANGLTSLPEEIQSLTLLRSLDVSLNDITALPAGIQGLTSLTTLDVEQNDLVTFPPEIQSLVNLATIDAGRNKITSMPAEIQSLAALKTFRLDNNDIATAEMDDLLDLLASTNFAATGKNVYLNSNVGIATADATKLATASAAPYSWNITT